jgi:hypothetical protein
MLNSYPTSSTRIISTPVQSFTFFGTIIPSVAPGAKEVCSMTENIKKLVLMGFAIIVASFMIISNAQAQSQAPKIEKDADYTIKSKDEYIAAERMVDALAEELYAIHQNYPDLVIQHHYSPQNELVDISVEGIDDPSVADHAASCYFKLEKLASAVRDVDPAFIPQRAEIKQTDILNEQQSKEVAPLRK